VTRSRALALAPLAAAGFVASAAFVSPREEEMPRVLVFSKTTGFRHDSIPDGIAAIEAISAASGLSVDATEDAAAFSPAGLSAYRAVVFLNTTGDVLDAAQEAALQDWVLSGGGFVGVHSAADTESGWPWYGELLGARFRSHPQIQSGTLRVETNRHPATRSLPSPWTRVDEWYNFDGNPRDRAFVVLLTIDEASYSGGDMGADHPMAWCRKVAAGRSFYTAGGHTRESFAEPEFREHLAGGLRWAAGIGDLSRSPRVVPPR
jgi:type 1 glutamine amidotransferase